MEILKLKVFLNRKKYYVNIRVIPRDLHVEQLRKVDWKKITVYGCKLSNVEKYFYDRFFYRNI